MLEKDLKVLIKRQGGSEDIAEWPVNEFCGIRYDNCSGGVRRKQSGYSLFGYIPYNEGKDLVKCSGRHDWGDNVMKVMIVTVTDKNSPYYEGYQEAKRLSSNTKPISIYPIGKPCTTRILELLAENNGALARKALREHLVAEGYNTVRMSNAIQRMKKDGRIRADGFGTDPKQLIALVK